MEQDEWSFWLLMGLLLLAHIAGLVSPLPSSAHAIGWAGQYQWIFVIMGYWVDRNRTTVPEAGPAASAAAARS